MKIFWSWQSDHPGNVSRHFVRTALEQAVASLKEELSIDEPEREITLDHDRKGVPGSPDLANIILEKIRRSEVFVADVTPVGATGSEPPKKLMNSNVAIELGYALHTVTDLRTIMVMNAAFGSRADLPFDLQHKAGPTFYRLQSDATKDQIEKARTKLAGELKVALREILSGLAPAAAPFQAAASRPGDPSRYFQVGQTLASRTGPFGNGLHSCKAEETPALYLRIIPTKPTVPLTRAEAIDVLRMGPPHLDPFYYPCGHISFEPNEFGAIAFEARHQDQLILSAAQLYLNREIWGFNTISLSPELAKSRGRPLGIPTLTVEQTYAVMLRQYLSFMNGKLGAPPPYRIEAGASGITGYFILMPNNFSDDAWGPILQDVSWSGILTSLDATAVDATLLKIFDAFFDAAACKRPEGLYGFPGATPGAVPR